MTTTLSEGHGDYADAVRAEVRAWMGRRGLRQIDLADRLGVNAFWVSRRVGVKANQVLDVEDLSRLAQVLDVPVTSLLPRLDSNQQPSGSRSPQVSGPRVTRDSAYASRKQAAQQPPRPSGPTLPEAA